jgi:hypothetical protein
MRAIKDIVIKVLIGAGVMYVLFFIYKKEIKTTVYYDVTIEATYNNDRQDTLYLKVAHAPRYIYLKDGNIEYRQYSTENNLKRWVTIASFVRRYRILSYQKHDIK